ncbi:MAG: glycosyltransferase [Thermoanaerobaculia bacterium]|nr:glycosyltransferase [Thermoanaerobaculia bacterium]
MRALITAVVPSLGYSPDLPRLLRDLRAEPGMELVLVHQGPESPDSGVLESVDRFLHYPRPLGFAAAVNRGLKNSRAAFLLLVNDDAILRPGAIPTLRSQLDRSPELASVQPLLLDERGRIDSSGVGWNAWWQAVQIGRGERPGVAGSERREVFGVHGAACLLRRRALEEVSLAPGEILDEELDTYYEDVELSGRLRAGGWTAAVSPDATGIHRGGVSGRALGRGKLRLLYGNRLLVLTRFLGPRILPRLPRILARDLLDAAERPDRIPGILAGWLRALRRVRGFSSRGSYRLDPDILSRFREP